jgi:hypothetical protein
LGRAALYAFGAGSITLATAACSSDEGTAIPLYGGPPTPYDSGAEDAPYLGVDAAYGGPPLDAGNLRDVGNDAPLMLDAAYGGPPIDAGADAPLMVDAAYGGPPIDGGGD